jgi:hypothetical protein
MSERMCPCGNCHATWDRAVLDLMHGPSKLSRDQAEAWFEAMINNHGDGSTT